MQDAAAIQGIESRYAAMILLMDERARRQWAAAEARSYGWGGVRAVSHATGMSPNTINRGLAELEAREADPETPIGSRLRKAGAGRRLATEADPDLAASLEQLVDPVTRGDPMSPLRWTCKSTTQLARELTRQGHPVSPRTVGRLLKASGYSLQGNRKSQCNQTQPVRLRCHFSAPPASHHGQIAPSHSLDLDDENAPDLPGRGRSRILEHETGLEPATPTLAKRKKASK